MARVALLIGIRDYNSRLESLPAAPRDVEALRRVLQSPNLGYFQKVDCLTPAADGETIDATTLAETIEGWCHRHEPEDTALIYISGHLIHAAAGEIYLAASDTHWEGDRLLQSRALPLTQVHHWLSHSAAAQKIAVLDCCMTFRQAPAAVPESTPDAEVQLSDVLGAQPRLILAASRRPTYSPAHKQGKTSLYTHYWIEGLLTGAAVAESSRWVVAADLHAYIQKRFQIAVPAIAPYLHDGDGLANTVRLAKAQFPLAEQRYRQQVEELIQQGQFSPVGRQILDLTWQRLGLTAECAAAIEGQSLHPHQVYQANLARYRAQIADIIQREYPLSEQSDRHLEATRQRLGLCPEDVLLIRRELTYPKHLHNLQTFREVLTTAMKDAHPVSDATRRELAQLQQMLGLSDSEVAALEQEISSQRSSHEQRCLQYQQALESAVSLGIANSTLTREELDAYRQSLGLTPHDADQIEQQMGQTRAESPGPQGNGSRDSNGSQQGSDRHGNNGGPYSNDSPNGAQQSSVAATPAPVNGTGDRPNPSRPESAPSTAEQRPPDEEKETMFDHPHGMPPAPDDPDFQHRQQQYADELKAAAQRHLPITPEDTERLRQLQEDLALSPETVRSISEPVIAEVKRAADAEVTKLSSYENAFQQAVARSFPLLPADRQALDHQRQRLGLNPQEVEAAEHQILARLAIEQMQGPTGEDAGETTPSGESAPTDMDVHQAIAPPAENGWGRSAPAEVIPPQGLEGADSRGDLLEQTVLHEDLPRANGSRSAFPLSLLDQEKPLRSPQGELSYESLRSALKKRDWRAADDETFAVLCQLASRGSRVTSRGQVEWLDAQDLVNIPAPDFQIIDQLWREASGDHFGFSIQRDIFMDAFREHSVANVATHFGKKVGWMMLERGFVGLFKYYNQLTFSLDESLPGHLPAKWFWEIPWWKSVLCGGLGNGRGGCGDDGGLLLKLYVHFNNLPPLPPVPRN
ncbi:MAG: GUN4 domain-containing protein [Elainellaceae cyanobacterium]